MIPPRLQLRDVSWETARRLFQGWIDGVQAVVNGGATLSETMAGQVVTFDWNDDNAPTAVKAKLSARPVAVLVLSAKRTGATEDVVSGSAVSWTWNAGLLSVSAITGLSSSTDYSVTVWAVGSAATPRSG